MVFWSIFAELALNIPNLGILRCFLTPFLGGTLDDSATIQRPFIDVLARLAHTPQLLHALVEVLLHRITF